MLLLIALAASLFVTACCCGEKKSRNHRRQPVVPFVPETAARPEGKNLLLIVVDTLRADRLGVYGYNKKTSPAIDAFAKESVVFERNYASSPWTAPSFGSLLTGVRPDVHRTGKWIKHRRVPGTVMIGAVQLYPLDKRLPTLAEVLGEQKQTATFASNPFLDPKLGFARGVDNYDQTHAHRRGKIVTKRAADWMLAHRDDPFFVMLHYMDPHTPYNPPERYKKMFVNEKKRGRIKAPFVPSTKAAMTLHPNNNELDYIKGLYDGEVRYVDDQLKWLFDQMKTAGLMDNTWVILTADHGEEHWDHGAFNHGFQYEDEVTRVPLIVRAPGGEWGAGKRVPHSVRLMDIYATGLDMFDIPRPAYLESKSLFDLISGQETENRVAYMEYQLFFRPKHAFFDGRYKLIKPRRGGGGFMYDLLEDPLEQTRLNYKHPAYKDVWTQMKREMRAKRLVEKHLMADYRERRQQQSDSETEQTDTPDSENDALSPEAVEALKALGYLE